MLTDLTFRVVHLVRAQPWLRAVIGVAIIVLGVIALGSGAGHGGLIAAGVMLVIGSLAALRGRRRGARRP